MNMLFENMAASILQHIDRESDIDESISGPYYFNENYNKLDETYEPATMTNQDDLQDDEGAFISKHVEIAAHQILDRICSRKS